LQRSRPQQLRNPKTSVDAIAGSQTIVGTRFERSTLVNQFVPAPSPDVGWRFSRIFALEARGSSGRACPNAVRIKMSPPRSGLEMRWTRARGRQSCSGTYTQRVLLKRNGLSWPHITSNAQICITSVQVGSVSFDEPRKARRRCNPNGQPTKQIAGDMECVLKNLWKTGLHHRERNQYPAPPLWAFVQKQIQRGSDWRRQGFGAAVATSWTLLLPILPWGGQHRFIDFDIILSSGGENRKGRRPRFWQATPGPPHCELK